MSTDRKPPYPASSCPAYRSQSACVLADEHLITFTVAATTLLATPAYAEYGADKDYAASYDSGAKNVNGDKTLYTPKAKVLAKGTTSSKVMVTMPSPGPLSADDYIDCMWVRDVRTGTVYEADFYYPNGQVKTKGRSGAPSDGSAPVEPTFVARVPGGASIAPVVHSAKGYVWEGAPVL